MTQGTSRCYGVAVPRVIADAGETVARRFLQFFAAIIRNKTPGLRATGPSVSFLLGATSTASAASTISNRCMSQPIPRPRPVDGHADGQAAPGGRPHAVRLLVTGQVIAVNPAYAVRSTSAEVVKNRRVDPAIVAAGAGRADRPYNGGFNREPRG